MIIEMLPITSLAEIDFDSLFADSIDRMDMNFIWPEVAKNNFEVKKKIYRDQLQSMINGKWPLKNEDDIFYMIVTKVDGVVGEFSAGFLDSEGFLCLRFNLTSSSVGNRNWRYTPEAHAARKQFLQNIGALGVREYTWVGSLLYRFHMLRVTKGNYTIEETPIIRENDPHPEHQQVMLTIRLN